jgi:hypothetical protein
MICRLGRFLTRPDRGLGVAALVLSGLCYKGYTQLESAAFG